MPATLTSKLDDLLVNDDVVLTEDDIQTKAWVDVTSDREFNVIYSTSIELIVSIQIRVIATDLRVQFLIDGELISQRQIDEATDSTELFLVIVPPNASYQIVNETEATLEKWLEYKAMS